MAQPANENATDRRLTNQRTALKMDSLAKNF